MGVKWYLKVAAEDKIINIVLLGFEKTWRWVKDGNIFKSVNYSFKKFNLLHEV